MLPISGDFRFELADEPSLASIQEMTQACIIHMRSFGIDQWDDIYPSTADFRRDVDGGNLYVLRDDSSQIAGCATLDSHQSPEYAAVSWAFVDGRIAVVHRL